MTKCENCGHEFEGNFCPQCGAPAQRAEDTPRPEDVPVQTEIPQPIDAEATQEAAPTPEQPVQSATPEATATPEKGAQAKKPFYKRWWFIALVVIVVLSALSNAGGNSGDASSDEPASASTQSEVVEDEGAAKEEVVEVPAPTLESISAVYSGSTEAGTYISSDSDDVTVLGEYSDGTSERLSGWTIDSPVELAAEQTYEITVSYGDEPLTCTFSVTCTTVDVDAYKASCASYSYEELARNPDNYVGQRIVLRGEVVQVMEDSGSVTLRVDVTQGTYIWTDTVLALYDHKDGESRILEDDIITMYGTFYGLYTYETVLGANVTVPMMFVEYVDFG